jgi:hypothetical protein
MVTIETLAPPKHIVTGSVARGGFTGDLSDIGVKVEFAQNGTVVKTAQVFLNANGGFTIPEVVHGTYDVTVRGGFWFKKTFSAAAVLEDVVLPTITLVQGDLNADSMVDVGDLGILAANSGGSGKSWAQGDFNGDGLVDVGDLGILAANYGRNTNTTMDFGVDYAKAFGTTVGDEAADDATNGSACSAMGLPIIVGLLLAGLMFGGLKFKE